MVMVNSVTVIIANILLLQCLRQSSLYFTYIKSFDLHNEVGTVITLHITDEGPEPQKDYLFESHSYYVLSFCNL